MAPLLPGSEAPPVPGAEPRPGIRALVFYKVTCPTCQIAAPAIERLYRGAPDGFVAVGQDPPEALESFAGRFATTFPALSDGPPYPVSDAYGLRVVPTVFVLEDGRVADVVESWDRDGWNRAAARLAASPVSEEGDGLPAFRPG